MNIPQALAQIVEGNDLSQDDAAAAFLQIMSGEATPGQIGALLAALRVKGETAERSLVRPLPCARCRQRYPQQRDLGRHLRYRRQW